MYLRLRSVISNPFGTRDWFHGTQFSHRWPGAVAEGTVFRTIQVHSMYLFVCVWLCRVFVAAWAFFQLWFTGFSSQWLLLLRSSRVWAQDFMVQGLSSSAACGIFLDQGSNPRLLHWQADSLLLGHQGSPSSALHRLCTLILLSLHQHLLGHQALDPGRWGPQSWMTYGLVHWPTAWAESTKLCISIPR